MDSAARHTKMVPAPLIVVFSLGAGCAAHLWHPARFLPDLGVATTLLGTLLCAGALAVGISGVREFHRNHTPTSPFQPTTTLVVSGVFRHTRNPMYLGFVLLTLGIAVAVNSLAFLLAAALLAGLLQCLVIVPEERFMSASFGAAFEDYRRRTRRWL